MKQLTCEIDEILIIVMKLFF